MCMDVATKKIKNCRALRKWDWLGLHLSPWPRHPPCAMWGLQGRVAECGSGRQCCGAGMAAEFDVLPRRASEWRM